MILRITEAQVVGPYVIEVSFNDGTRGIAELGSLLGGPIFEPLRDPAYFASMRLDPVCGTVAWENGADFAPEAIRSLVTSGSVV